MRGHDTKVQGSGGLEPEDLSLMLTMAWWRCQI